MAPEALRLRPIEAVSPTLVEALRLCKLRAGLSRAENADQYVLGNPKAWLGTAYHAVLEAAGSDASGNLEVRAPALWDLAIQREYSRARVHRLDRRFGPPESWPGYHVVAAMAFVRAKELAEREASQRAEKARCALPGDILREKTFSGADGRIVGRPDMVRPGEIVDFKSGEIFAEGDQEQVKGSYVRQLRIYGFLVRETLGWWPRRGVLLPMIGSLVEVDLEPGACEKEAADALRLLGEYNAAIARGHDPADLASPSAATCRWCPFQLYCPAFWNHVRPEWAGDLLAGALAGVAEEQASWIHNGLALSLSVLVDQGTVPANQRISLFPLDGLMHPDVLEVKAADRVRATGLFQRSDRSLVATKRTMIGLERNLPEIKAGA
ncbi:PD-(D/E)XK nuclease family protein [Thermopirellula anaerolimosa]